MSTSPEEKSLRECVGDKDIKLLQSIYPLLPYVGANNGNLPTS
jgi:hypothetical protein